MVGKIDIIYTKRSLDTLLSFNLSDLTPLNYIAVDYEVKLGIFGK